MSVLHFAFCDVIMELGVVIHCINCIIHIHSKSSTSSGCMRGRTHTAMASRTVVNSMSRKTWNWGDGMDARD
jgi:hypothetical protein